MPYQVVILPRAARQIASWHLSDFVLVEVHLRLREDLAQNPSQKLQRQEMPFDGMVYRFRMIDPENRFHEHFFAFHVIYGGDEQTLYIARGGHISASDI